MFVSGKQFGAYRLSKYQSIVAALDHGNCPTFSVI